MVTIEELAEDIITRRSGETLGKLDYQHECRRAGLRDVEWSRLADLCDAAADAQESAQNFRS